MKIRRVKKPKLVYNKQQKEVIALEDGKCLVSAGPGSGKTRVITTRIARLVNSGVNPQSILATTFTKKAAGEMNERLKQDSIDTDRMAVQTMHSFCYKIMRESKRWPEWAIDDKDVLNILIKQATGWKGMKWKGVDITLVGDFISLAKNSLLRPEQCHEWDVLQAEPFFGDTRYPQAYFEVEELRQQRKLITFDDMLIDGVDVLETDEALRNKYQKQFDFVIVDEFQDSNIAQIRLMELMAAPQWNLMCVGDVDQCHPSGTMIQTANDEVPIEELRNGDYVRVWNRHAGRIVGSSPIRVASRRIYDEVFEVTVGERSVEATAEHKFFVQWNKDHERWVTYLMYRKDLGYRVGWCKLFANKARIYHLGQRARLEKADKAWILSVHDNPRDASIEESIVSLLWQIPTVMFEPTKQARHYDKAAIKQIFATVDSRSNGENCLRDYGRNPEFPLYEHHKMPHGGNARRIFITTPRNIFPEIMSVPTVDGWQPVDNIDSCMMDGRVYSLDVDEHHNYVANGIVVHNCIYEWRGAKPQFMVEFVSRYDAQVISMGTNYRCAPNIMSLAAQCIEHNEARITKELGAHKEHNAKILCRELLDMDAESATVADEVEQLIEDDVPPGEMFVLYRTNAQSRAIEEEFCRRKIPHVVIGGASFYQRKEVQDLLSYLRVIHNPKDTKSGLRAVNRPFRYVSRAVLDDVEAETSKEKDFITACSRVCNIKGNRGLAEFLDIMSTLDDHVREYGDRPGEMLSIIINRTGYLQYLATNEGSDTAENSRVANVGELIRSADRFDNIKDFLEFVDWQIAQRKKKKKVKDAVQCMTVHKAKGLEAKAVFLIGTNEGILPHAKCTNECEEERRLYYVATTRAMEFLHISCVQNLGMAGGGMLEPSRFIGESGLEIESLTACRESSTVLDSAGGQQDERIE